jgi:Domain of unknown function (DUF1707)
MNEQDRMLRAADADRESAAERLRRHHAEGRLDAEEFQERIDRCFQARTLQELDGLFSDLPPERREPEPERSSRRPFLAGRPPWVPFVPFLPLLLAVVAISAGFHHSHHHWYGFAIPVAVFMTVMVWRRGRWALRGRRHAA